jgi:VWFA-related protein
MTGARACVVMLMTSACLSGVSRSSRAQEGQPAFSSETTLVEVSAIITAGDSSVSDLAAEEIEILDNGVPQRLVAFEYVDLRSVTGPGQRRDFVLILDDLQVNQRRTHATIQLANRAVDALGPFDRLAVLNTGPFELVLQLSTDRAKARSLISRFRGLSGNPVMRTPQEHSAQVLLRVIRNVAQAMAKGDPTERRTILVISEGTGFGPMVTDPAQRREDYAFLELYDKVMAEASLANVAVYCVDPTGLEAPIPTVSGTTDADVARIASRVGTDRGDIMMGRRYGLLRRVADATGGTLVDERNNLAAGLPGMMRDSRQYYRLAYVQPAVLPSDAGKARSIEVRVSRPGTTVRARRTYLPKASSAAQ